MTRTFAERCRLGLCRWSFRACLFVLVLLALYCVVGRVLLWQVTQRQQVIVADVEELLDARLQVGELQGIWRGLQPGIVLRDVHLAFSDEEGEQHQLAALQLTVDVLRSLWHRRWIIGRVDVQSMHLDIVENAEGAWTLRGFRAEGGFNERYLDLVLDAGRLSLSDSRLSLIRQNGQALELGDMQARLSRGANEHALSVLLSLPEASEPLRFALRLTGDPRQQFSYEGFLALEESDLRPLVDFFDPPQVFPLKHLQGSLALWFRNQAESPFSARLQLQALDLAVQAPADGQEIRLSAMETDLSFDKQGEAWRLLSQGLSLEYEGQDWSAGPFQVAQVPDEGLTLQSAGFALGPPAQLALQTGHLPDILQRVLTDMQPQGRVYALQAFVPADEGAEGLRLQARLQNLAIDAWEHVPAVSGLHGQLHMGLREGYADIHSEDFRIHLPKVFEQSWHYREASGRVSWQIPDEGFEISSGPIHIHSPEVQGRARFAVRQGRDSFGEADTELVLNVGVDHLSQNVARDYLPTIEALRPVMDWLNEALEAGDLRDSGFIFRGSTRQGAPPSSLSALGHFQTAGLTLAYLPDWPLLHSPGAQVLLRHREAEIMADSAEVAGLQLESIRGRVVAAGEQPHVFVEARGQGPARAGLDVLRETPLRAQVGEVFDDWQVDGALTLDLGLTIPLDQPGAPVVDLRVSTENASLALPEYSLRFEHLRGQASYHTDTGLQSDDLQAELFGEQVSARIRERPGGEDTERGQILIQGSGRASIALLQSWEGMPEAVQPFLALAEGETDYEAELRLFPIPDGGMDTELDIYSRLQGVQVNAPAPFSKYPEESLPLTVSLVFFPERAVHSVRAGDLMHVRLGFQEGTVQGGRVWLGDRRQDLPPARQWRPQNLVVEGKMDFFEFTAWQSFAEQFTQEEDDTGLLQRLSRVDVSVDELLFHDLLLEDIRVQLSPESGGWNLHLDNALLSGHFSLPADLNDTWTIRLDSLHLPETGESEERRGPAGPPPPDPLEALDPRALPPLDVDIADFRIGESQKLGQWSFRFTPDSGGAWVDDLRIAMTDARLRSPEDEDAGARLRWDYDGETHRTEVASVVSAGNLSRVLPELGFATHIQSRSARLDSTLSWQGSPAAFDLKRLEGRVAMRVNDGRFVDVDSGSARFLGALNYDSLVRRLQLDFSDLYQRGLAFDRLDGVLTFHAGRLETEDRLLISGPSSKIRVQGELDLLRQWIDAELLVTVPISQNISVLAGLLGAWPIALSAYVAGRLFEDQVADLTAIAYRLEGPLTNVDAEFVDAEELVEDIEPEEQSQ